MELKSKLSSFFNYFYLPWSKYFSKHCQTAEEYLIKICTLTSFLVNLLLIFTNIYWSIMHFVDSNDVNPLWMIIFCIGIALLCILYNFLLWPRNTSVKYKRALILLTIFTLYLEVCVVGSTKNYLYHTMMNQMTNLTYDEMQNLMSASGIPIASFYLVAIIFLPLYKGRDCVFATLFAILCIVLQMFLPGHEVFNVKGNFVVLASAIVAAYILRWLYLLFIKTDMNLQKEQEKYTETIVDTFEAMSEAIDFKDSYTRGHSTRVAEVSVEIAKRMGFDDNELNMIYYGGLVHDIGKIGVPDSILNKPGHLTSEEYAIIKQHPVNGSVLLSRLVNFPSMKAPVRWHHERYDGKGYPDGLKGEEIPLVARILAVADAFDAMNSNRAYRRKLSIDEVKKQIINNSGTQFDPKIAKILVDLIDEGIVK